MKMKQLAAMALTATLAAGVASAELVIPDLSYRTGPYAAGGTPFSDGYQDYFNMLNARDGGIGGVMGIASWMGVQGEREDGDEASRCRVCRSSVRPRWRVRVPVT